MVVHTFSPSTQRQKQADLYEFKTSLVYKASPGQQRLCYTKKSCLGKKTKTNHQQQEAMRQGSHLSYQNESGEDFDIPTLKVDSSFFWEGGVRAEIILVVVI